MTQDEFGLTVSEVIGKEAWKPQTVSAAERGKRSFTAAEIVVICRVLGVGVEALFHGIDLPTTEASERNQISPHVKESLGAIRAELQRLEGL